MAIDNLDFAVLTGDDQLKSNALIAKSERGIRLLETEVRTLERKTNEWSRSLRLPISLEDTTEWLKNSDDLNQKSHLAVSQSSGKVSGDLGYFADLLTLGGTDKTTTATATATTSISNSSLNDWSDWSLALDTLLLPSLGVRLCTDVTSASAIMARVNKQSSSAQDNNSHNRAVDTNPVRIWPLDRLRVAPRTKAFQATLRAFPTALDPLSLLHLALPSSPSTSTSTAALLQTALLKAVGGFILVNDDKVAAEVIARDIAMNISSVTGLITKQVMR